MFVSENFINFKTKYPKFRVIKIAGTITKSKILNRKISELLLSQKKATMLKNAQIIEKITCILIASLLNVSLVLF